MVVTILAGGMYSDFSPFSLTIIDGQQLSTQPVDSETTVPVEAQAPHPPHPHPASADFSDAPLPPRANPGYTEP